MNVFQHYARYYNLLYQDKDYRKEAQFVQQRLQAFRPNVKTILELGCGTSKHATVLAEHGYEVCGVDRSSEMLQQAKDNRAALPAEVSGSLEFQQGDIRTIRLDRQFDAVIALFHVVSYQTTETDLEEIFTTVIEHLKPGGCFLFDCWYGPAVLATQPEVRVKRFEDDQIKVIRIAEPEFEPNNNLVNVHYEIIIQEKQTQKTEILHETHVMRYFFTPELRKLFDDYGFQLNTCEEWMTGRLPGCDTWGCMYIGTLHKG